MTKPRRDHPSPTRMLRLACVPVLILSLLLLPAAGLAFQAPPPPPETPTYTPEPPTATFTPLPPTATFTPLPPTATFTPLPPTAVPAQPTATATRPVPSATPWPTMTAEAEGGGEPAANELCQSAVEGYVLGADGRHVAGATVTIEGPGWSSGAMSDDNGRYGFAGLCAGTAALRAFLPGGEAAAVATVTLSGQDRLRHDLSFGGASTAAAPLTQASQATAQAAPTAGAEAGMPVTGYAGWLLAGGAALGALLLLSAGGRRALQAHERARSRE
jgi:hypothetical protein